jgi:hypothetical protein
VENTPNGFPRLAAFQCSESNFSLYRSFNYLHSRVLLDLQDEIRNLEEELDRCDWDDFEDDPDRLRSRDIDVSKAAREGNARNRRVILGEIREKLMQYGAYIAHICHNPALTIYRRSTHQGKNPGVFPKAIRSRLP